MGLCRFVDPATVLGMPNTHVVSLFIVVVTAVWVCRELRAGQVSVPHEVVAALAGVGVHQVALWAWLAWL